LSQLPPPVENDDVLESIAVANLGVRHIHAKKPDTEHPMLKYHRGAHNLREYQSD